MDKDGVFLTTAVLPLAIKYTVVARWRSPADGVAGLGGFSTATGTGLQGWMDGMDSWMKG